MSLRGIKLWYVQYEILFCGCCIEISSIIPLWYKNLKSYVRHKIESISLCRHNTVEHLKTWPFKIPITQHLRTLQ